VSIHGVILLLFRALFRDHSRWVLVTLALRQQLAVLFIGCLHHRYRRLAGMHPCHRGPLEFGCEDAPAVCFPLKIAYSRPPFLPYSRTERCLEKCGSDQVGVTRHTNAVLQVYASESTVRDTTIEEIKADKYQASLGLRSRRGHVVYGFAVTENLENFGNTPDVGVSLTLAWFSLRP